MPKVSICIPTYNRKHYLKETLDSVFAQTYRDYEVVVIDDGSTDGTEQMLKECNYPVRYHWWENRGEPAARNKLAELAQGEYLTFLDSDDLLFPYAVEELVNTVESGGPQIVAYGSYVSIDENGGLVRRKHRKLPSGYITGDLFQYIYVHSCGTMCTKKLLEEGGYFDTSLPVCSPYALWLNLSLRHKFMAVEKPLFKRRRHLGNLSVNSFANRVIELNVLEKFFHEHLESNGHGVISHRDAMKRLSKEGYRAARCAIGGGINNHTAARLLSESFRRYSNCKSLLWWLIAKYMS